MPELPEVETIRLGLTKNLIGLKIKSIEVLNPKSFQGDKDFVVGKTVTNVWRRAKVLGIDLSSLRGVQQRSNLARINSQLDRHASLAMTLLFHLKMSGQLIYQGKREKGKGEIFAGGHPTKDMKGEMPNRSTRVIFTFSDGSKLFFNDQRKFGWIKVIENVKLKMEDLFKNYGPEPLEKEFTVEVFKERLFKRKKTSVKVAILDQQIVSGIGNIYACDACFLARIHPQRLVETLSDEEIKKLHKAIKESLQNGIKHGGSSLTHYLNSEGGKGNYLDYAKVYNRKGKPCRRCKTKIEKITLGGRGTYYCKSCQI